MSDKIKNHDSAIIRFNQRLYRDKRKKEFSEIVLFFGLILLMTMCVMYILLHMVHI